LESKFTPIASNVDWFSSGGGVRADKLYLSNILIIPNSDRMNILN
jgi:hypothetical protein